MPRQYDAAAKAVQASLPLGGELHQNQQIMRTGFGLLS
jgi:hypothetical protein